MQERRTLRSAWLGLLLGLLSAASVHAQDNPEINHAYFAVHDTGAYAFSGQSIQVYRIPFSYQVRTLEEDNYGLKLMLQVSFGVHDFEIGEIVDSISTVTVMPGIELEFPYRGGWIFRPAVEVGQTRTLDGGPNATLWAARGWALKGVTLRGNQLTIGTGLEYSGTDAGELGVSFTDVKVGLDYRIPIGASLKGSDLDIAAFGLVKYYLDDIVLPVPGQDPLIVDEQYEIGFMVGVSPKIKIFGFSVTRVGVSYYTGDRIDGFRLLFGRPF